MIAKLDSLKTKKKKSSEDLKISRGKSGVFQKGNYWYQIYDDNGHMNEWYRQQLLKGNTPKTAKTAPKGKSKKG